MRRRAAASDRARLRPVISKKGRNAFGREYQAIAGVVISASHNPFEDNGIKFFNGQGEKLPDVWEEEIEAILEQALGCAAPEAFGKARRLNDAAGRYIEFCKSTFPAHLHLRGIRLVVDTAHGAAYQVAGAVFHELGAEVLPMGHQPDGLNINRDVGATAPQAMVQRVLAEGADYGIALDGDADRIVMADRAGRIYNGDELLYAIVRHRMKRHGRADLGGVVGTLMSNLSLERRLNEQGIDFRRARVGDRYVLELLRETGWLYGGESSGHLLCLDRHTTGDGIISALQVLAATVDLQRSLPDLISDLVLCPQVLVNVALPPQVDWRSHPGFQARLLEVQQLLLDRGRVLVRPSGTEPLLRIMVETQDAHEAQALANALAEPLIATP
ncbi:MAG: phosphoglucosamine mutase [Betaproteobacteria bacterium]|nr:phosphoglucosamine mutase [Betaproteobacteria bacterium]